MWSPNSIPFLEYPDKYEVAALVDRLTMYVDQHCNVPLCEGSDRETSLAVTYYPPMHTGEKPPPDPKTVEQLEVEAIQKKLRKQLKAEFDRKWRAARVATRWPLVEEKYRRDITAGVQLFVELGAPRHPDEWEERKLRKTMAGHYTVLKKYLRKFRFLPEDAVNYILKDVEERYIQEYIENGDVYET